MAPFEPGDVVVCVDASPPRIARSERMKALVRAVCRLGAVHRVADVRVAWGRRSKGRTALVLQGIDSNPAAGFDAERFRKIDDEVTEEFRVQMRSLGKPVTAPEPC